MLLPAAANAAAALLPAALRCLLLLLLRKLRNYLEIGDSQKVHALISPNSTAYYFADFQLITHIIAHNPFHLVAFAQCCFELPLLLPDARPQ